MDAAGGMRRERVLGGWWRPGLAWGRWLRGREVLAGIWDRGRVTGHSWGEGHTACRGQRNLMKFMIKIHSRNIYIDQSEEGTLFEAYECKT